MTSFLLFKHLKHSVIHAHVQHALARSLAIFFSKLEPNGSLAFNYAVGNKIDGATQQFTMHLMNDNFRLFVPSEFGESKY